MNAKRCQGCKNMDTFYLAKDLMEQYKTLDQGDPHLAHAYMNVIGYNLKLSNLPAEESRELRRDFQGLIDRFKDETGLSSHSNFHGLSFTYVPPKDA